MDRLPDLSSLSHAEKDALIHALWAQVQALTAQVATLAARIAALEARLGTCSSPVSVGAHREASTKRLTWPQGF